MYIKSWRFNYHAWNVLISSSDFHYTFEESSDFRYWTEVIDLHAIVLIAEDRWTTTLLSTKSQLMPYQDSSYKTKQKKHAIYQSIP